MILFWQWGYLGLAEIVFRAAKSKGGYLRHLPSCNWLYLSTLATLKEFASIKVAFSVTVVFYSNLLKWFVVKLLLIGFVGIERA